MSKRNAQARRPSRTPGPRFDPAAIAGGELKIPRAALRFAADVAVDGQQADPAGTVPVSIRARSGNVLDHWFFGRIVHDFEGMRHASAKLPIDYAHRDDEVLGYSDKTDTAGGELVMHGFLIPFTETDRATEIIHKADRGMTWQGSIYFDPFELVLEYVPEGMTSPVNGGQFEGPGVIAREWMLRGVAICPYGYDPATAVQLSQPGDDEPVAVSFMEPTKMSKSRNAAAPNRHARRKAAALAAKQQKPKTKLATKRPATKPAGRSKTKFEAAEEDDEEDPTEAEADDPEEMEDVEEPTETVDDCDCKGEEVCECDDDDEEDPDAETPVEEMEADDEAPADDDEEEEEENAGQQSAKRRRGKLTPAARDVRRYITAFGPQGGQWYADGLTFDQAQTKFNKQLRDENAGLQKKVAAQAAQLNALRGEADPVSFEPEEGKKKKASKHVTGLTAGQAKFAAGLKIPK